ncbi:hypothetical protein MRX96_045931 [Rhipicephalus microplus]
MQQHRMDHHVVGHLDDVTNFRTVFRSPPYGIAQGIGRVAATVTCRWQHDQVSMCVTFDLDPLGDEPLSGLTDHEGAGPLEGTLDSTFEKSVPDVGAPVLVGSLGGHGEEDVQAFSALLPNEPVW